jgi:hypothetical protein
MYSKSIVIGVKKDNTSAYGYVVNDKAIQIIKITDKTKYKGHWPKRASLPHEEALLFVPDTLICLSSFITTMRSNMNYSNYNHVLGLTLSRYIYYKYCIFDVKSIDNVVIYLLLCGKVY